MPRKPITRHNVDIHNAVDVVRRMDEAPYKVGIDRATDVLSFPADSHPGVARDRPHILGDVVIATGVARRQARRIGDTFENELRRLSLHGLLHVLGYDHETDDGEMARIERKLLRRGGVSESSQ